MDKVDCAAFDEEGVGEKKELIGDVSLLLLCDELMMDMV
jgi:hypothetical protein